MLQNLREHAQGWIAGIIVAILCLAFALWGIEYYISNGRATETVAKVDGVKITQQEWDAEYKRQRQQQGGELAQSRLKTISLNKLIAQQVLYAQAKREGFSMSNEQLGLLIAQTPLFQEKGQFSPRRYQYLVHELYPTEQDFIQKLSRESLIWQAKTGIETSAFVLPAELDRMLSLAYQKRDFSYAVIPAKAFVGTIVAAEKELQAYYQAHQDQFLTPEEVSIQYIELSPDEIRKNLEITATEIDQYYQENSAAFSGKTLDQARPMIEKILRQQKTEQTLASMGDQLANLTYTNPDTLNVASEATGLPIRTTDFFSRESQLGLAANPKVITAAFSDGVLKQRNNSDLIPLDNQRVVVLRVNDYKPSRVRPLLDVSAAIAQQLKIEASQKKAQQLGEKVVGQLKQGDSLQQLAAKNNLSVKEEREIGRNASTIPREILQFAFGLAPKLHSYGGERLANGDYLVMVLKKVANALPQSISASDRDRIKKDLARQMGQLDYFQYIASAMGKAKITY